MNKEMKLRKINFNQILFVFLPRSQEKGEFDKFLPEAKFYEIIKSAI